MSKIYSIIGGGGKTSLIQYMAQNCFPQKKVLVCTTTHIYMPTYCKTLLSPSKEDIFKNFEKTDLLAIGCTTEHNKLSSVPWLLDSLHELADIILVEADGSRGLPIKAPAEHEPVLAPNTDYVLAVAGLDAIGHPISQVAHRPELYAKLLNKNINDIVTIQDFTTILQSPYGQKKAVYCEYAIVLNKADTPQRLSLAKQCLSFLQEKVFVTSLQNNLFYTKRFLLQ